MTLWELCKNQEKMSTFPEVPITGHESLLGREILLSPCSRQATDCRLPLLLSIHNHLTPCSFWHTNLNLSGPLPSHQHFFTADLDQDLDHYSHKIRWQALALGFHSKESWAVQNDEFRGNHQPWCAAGGHGKWEVRQSIWISQWEENWNLPFKQPTAGYYILAMEWNLKNGERERQSARKWLI